MSTSKSKNIIIIILLLLNIILLSVYIFDRAETRQENEAEIAALERVIKQHGLTMSKDIDFDITAPDSCSIMRNQDNDDKLIEKLIGSLTYKEDRGGNVIFYSTRSGQALLRGTGEIELIYDANLPELDADHVQSVAKLMKKHGIDVNESLAELNQQSDSSTLNIPCVRDGYTVYNSKLNFTVSSNKVMMIKGTRIFDGDVTERGEELVDSVSAIMYFLDSLRSEGYVCSRITGLEAGYFMNVAVSGECTLRPVWRVSTDTGDVYINAVSGKVESLAA